jgi:hypothetical protein
MPGDGWRFQDPPNVASFTVRQIVREGAPILLVCHDAEDGGWQFLTGGPVLIEDAMLVALSTILKLDGSVGELADLPLGWQAKRESANADWVREPYEGAAG